MAHLGARLHHLLLDTNYAVRAAAGQLLSALLLVSIDARRFLDEELLPYLPLALPHQMQPQCAPNATEGVGWAAVAAAKEAEVTQYSLGDDGSHGWSVEASLVPFWETGVTQLVEVAMAAPELEGRVLLLLVGHSAEAAGRLGRAAGAAGLGFQVGVWVCGCGCGWGCGWVVVFCRVWFTVLTTGYACTMHSLD